MVLAALAVDPPAADVILLEMLFGAHRLSPLGVKCVSLCYLRTGADESSAVGREIIAYRRLGATSGSRRVLPGAQSTVDRPSRPAHGRRCCTSEERRGGYVWVRWCRFGWWSVY